MKDTYRYTGFSLIEVVLALGVFLVTILAFVGLLGPTLKSVNEVENTDEITSVVNTLNAFLQKSPGIADDDLSKFEVIYNNVADGGEATVFVFRKFSDSTSALSTIEVGFEASEIVGDPASASVNSSDFANAAGTIYRCVLTASSVTPSVWRSGTRNSDGIYTLVAANVANYTEGYFPMEIRIFAEDPPGPNSNFDSLTRLNELADEEPIFTYNTAIVR
ncbi:MAG: hypothetical protein AAF546_12555 [Verrucomicrobiota bacterium]